MNRGIIARVRTIATVSLDGIIREASGTQSNHTALMHHPKPAAPKVLGDRTEFQEVFVTVEAIQEMAQLGTTADACYSNRTLRSPCPRWTMAQASTPTTTLSRSLAQRKATRMLRGLVNGLVETNVLRGLAAIAIRTMLRWLAANTCHKFALPGWAAQPCNRSKNSTIGRNFATNASPNLRC